MSGKRKSPRQLKEARKRKRQKRLRMERRVREMENILRGPMPPHLLGQQAALTKEKIARDVFMANFEHVIHDWTLHK